jgi:uncharacterized protein GlcG (DUF336 family)
MKNNIIYLFFGFIALLQGCGAEGGAKSEQLAVDQTQVLSESAAGCTGDCVTANLFLTVSDVELIISQAVAEAQARNLKATIAISDRVGNVLAVFRMTGADEFITISSTANTLLDDVSGGLENVNIIPDTMVAISKAITGAYLSTEGNAFSTRTASQIIQENFNPGEDNTPSGPLFGVQFSQLACSDFNLRFSPLSLPSAGPRRSPLGLSADPGGLPLYKAGTPVGAIGVITDGLYGLDKDINGFDLDDDELVALAGTYGFAAPLNRRGDVITIVGKTARFIDVVVSDIISTDAMSFSEINNNVGALVAVAGYYDGKQQGLTADRNIHRVVLPGTAFGQPSSGIVPADPSIFKNQAGESLDAFIFVDDNNNNRFPAKTGLDAPNAELLNRLTQAEVQEILNQAISIANKTRAQIRQPNGSQARVSISIVDTQGNVLAMGRTRDAAIFGSDVSLQKARTAVFFSGTGKRENAPADLLNNLPPPLYLAALAEPVNLSNGLDLLASPKPKFSDYVDSLQLFIGVPDALEKEGSYAAFSDRAGGNLSRPNFPDGPVEGPHGPLSKPKGQWSVFSVGLQSDLVYNALIQHVAFVLGAAPDVGQNCTGNTGLSNSPFSEQNAINGLANGIQIFPGSVPIYRGDILIGGIGVSGDGVDQDDMISFLAVHQASLVLNNGLQNAPSDIRADKIDIPGQDTRLRYVNCPQAPFIDTDKSEVCNGL